MIYCLNPKCPHPSDPMNAYGKICRNCGEKLLIKQQYIATKILGVGGFAKTFEVESGSIKKVLKVLNLSPFNSPEKKDKKDKVINLFRREAEVLSRLDHPGIPKVEPDAYFKIEFSNGEELHCLLMEKIDGINLQQWLYSQPNQTISIEQAREWLKQLVEILEQVHVHGFFHRDIKPANIMLRENGLLALIDFGAVRDLAETFLQEQDTAQGTCIGSVGYAPPEQFLYGQAVQQSDFFALGRTFVHLLTGVHPCDIAENQKTSRFIWQDKLPKIAPSRFGFILRFRAKMLCDLLDAMMEIAWEDRPKNTQVILAILNRKTPIPRTLKKVISIAGIAVIGVTSGYWYLTGVGGCERIWMRRFTVNDKMSCGEEILMVNSVNSDKQAGVNAFAAGNYQLAVKLLEKSWQQSSNPETLIYLNNARIRANNYKAATVAVVAPISNENNDNINSSREMLQGIAQAQNEFNQKSQKDKTGLLVLIASDENRTTNAQNVAKSLGEMKDIIAVVGHFRSDTTLSAIAEYQEKNLLLISSTATSDDLSSVCKPTHPNCFFRVVSSNRITAEKLSNYLKSVNKQNVAAFYNPNSNYSKSLLEEFHNRLTQLGGKVVAEIPLSDSIDTNINQVKQKNADAIVLFPTTDGLTSDLAVQVIEYANQFNYLVVGGDSLDSPKILRKGDDNKIAFTIALPWYQGVMPSEFTPQAKKLWGPRTSWHTAMTYDATKVLIAALEQQPSPNRDQIRLIMTNPNFKAMGSTGEISFENNGNRKQKSVHLVKVVSNQKTGKPEFLKIGE